MGKFSPHVVRDHFQRVENGATTKEKGDALEDLVCHVFGSVPGVSVAARNVLSPFGTEELDIVFWNQKVPRGLFFLQSMFMVECKNWSTPVDGQVVSYFASRLKHNGCDDGVLVAAHGITGNTDPPSAAHYHITMALAEHRRILVVTREELERLRSTRQLVELLKEKRLQLVLNRTQLV